MAQGNSFPLKRKTSKRSGTVPSFAAFETAIISYNPINCLASGAFAIIQRGVVTSMLNFNAIGKCVLPKRHVEREIFSSEERNFMLGIYIGSK